MIKSKTMLDAERKEQFKIVGARVWIQGHRGINELPRGYIYDYSSKRDEGGGFVSYLVTGKLTQPIEPKIEEYWVADEHLLDEKPEPPNGAYVKVWRFK